MIFDPNNHIVRLCAAGMASEAEGKNKDALLLFEAAWKTATNDQERSIAAHYVARQQEELADKLQWNELALDHALKVEGDAIKALYPSLYLNIAKCYEDMGNAALAKTSYDLAESFTKFLSEDGYGKMISAGITAGIRRLET